MAPVSVLIVDDQQPFLEAAVEVVAAAAAFVVVGTVESGEACLEAVTELRPQLVLLDIDLPGVNGIEVARRLTAAPSAPVVVLLSTYDEETFAEAGGSGAAAYISKSDFGADRLSSIWSLATGMSARSSEEPSTRAVSTI